MQPDQPVNATRERRALPAGGSGGSGLAQWRIRAGRFKPINGKSLLVCIGARPSPWVEELLRAFEVTNPRENVFFLGADHRGPAEVCKGAQLPYPYRCPGLPRRFLRKLRAGLVVVDRGAAPPGFFVASARADNIAVAEVAAPGAKGSGAVLSGIGEMEPMAAARQLSRFMAVEREPYVKLKKRLRFFLWTHVLYYFYRGRLRKRSSFPEIYRALGEPGSILCLGNGPSCEDPTIAEGACDAVFRVNHRWLQRGLHCRVDAVFTGAVESVLKVGTDSLYVFINPDRAMRMVMRASRQVPRLSFANAEDLGFPLDEFAPYQPTNGLIMVYFAVMLQPPALTIAGIDLFRDPRGAYPGKTETPNHYTSAHDEAREIGLLLELLARYRGELTIVGDKLASEYENYTREHGHRH